MTKSALIIHPEYNLYQRGNNVFCSSLQIAESFSKRHDHVIRDIESINVPKSGEVESNALNLEMVENIADFFRENFIRTTYTDKKGEKRPMYLMTEDGFTLLVNGYTGLNALYFKIQYIKQFRAMRNFIKNYILAKDEYPIFAQAIEDAYDEPKAYHYSNECNMIYRIVLGMDAKHFREIHNIPEGKSIRPFLSEAQYKAVRELQKEDIRLLYRGVDYQERKYALAVKALPEKLS